MSWYEEEIYFDPADYGLIPNPEVIYEDGYYVRFDPADLHLISIYTAEAMIVDGDYDELVADRAVRIGFVDKAEADAVRYDDPRQGIHRANHPDGPYGFEYCYKCGRNNA